MEPFQILCSVAAVILALYYYLTSNFDYWKSRGVPGPRPIPGFGNLKDFLLRKETLGDYVLKLYTDYKDKPLIGIFTWRTPILIVKDPELIKNIFIKDFPTFADRGITTHEKAEPLSQNLFNLNPQRWRPLRAKMSPIFTSRKLKEMFSLISDCADHLVHHTEELANKNEPIECCELMAKYTTDVIGSCAFGLEINALSLKDNEFRRIGRNVFHPPWSDLIRDKIKKFSPWFYDVLGYILPDTEITSFFMRLVIDSMEYRDKNNIVRHDFIDILRDFKKRSDKMSDIDFTDSLIASQAFLFFSAGFETSSSVMSNLVYELALNQEVQNKLREEINEEYTKRDGNLTYDNIKEMDYLNKVFKETLRKYPPMMFYTRKTTSNYTFDSVKANIPKGQYIWIPVFALQHDPNIYPEPDIFDPERFNEKAVQNRHPMYFLPFGDGPRNCIASRFAIYEVTLGILKLLRHYKFEPCEKTEIPYIRNEETFVTTSKNGIYLKIIKINQKNSEDQIV
ncbi:PREDICTED: probable cytochrome P450 6a14 isoform X1 [Wasmannia auropunctata]|uniref:probable cytochrome P450 6a14 isoform X1 n=1 Tax=Wasmannia auropunctata TaxID=64793 RepID=UPI0005ED75E3|nr:PREDICTED: probable cytochrome P450 6a14 isoform X1 [Wasmannia auropunctata]XP_011704429.1 PREDICTED: probable cytochrome P450 6a14 isoform X1 [Wasmannia auropunctata]